MSKERLEEIAYNVGVSLDGEKAIMSSDDYDFLYNYALEQVERVQELEEWRNEVTQNVVARNAEFAKCREQNKRYREALKNIYELAEYDEYDNTLEQIVSEIEKALEGEE